MVPGQEVVAGMGSGSSASPLSTGGAGTIFEYRVGALALAAVLRGDRFEALGVPVTQVGFQQNASGHYLDDFVVEGLGGDGLLLAEFQVKRRVVPVPSDRQWRSVITQCVAALDADEAGLASRRHFLGLASGGPARQLGDLRELTRWARTHPTVESLRELIVASGAIPARVRERWRYLSETVGQVLADSRGPVTGDEAEAVAFRIASALRVWVVEVEEGERDYRNALDRLGDLLTPGAADAAVGLFLQLADIAQELGSRAGRINARGLRDELARRGVPLIPVSRAALAAASMNLPLRNAAFTGRDGLLDQLALQLRGNEPAVVAAHGLGGVGKSQLVLEYAHRHRGDYALVWWLRGESRLTVITDLTGLAPALGLQPDDEIAVHQETEFLAVRREALRHVHRGALLDVLENLRVARFVTHDQQPAAAFLLGLQGVVIGSHTRRARPGEVERFELLAQLDGALLAVVEGVVVEEDFLHLRELFQRVAHFIGHVVARPQPPAVAGVRLRPQA